MRARAQGLAGLAAIAALLLSAAIASGYTGQVAATANVAVRGEVTCAAPFTVTATILDVDGAPVDELAVAWAFVTTQSADDTVGTTPTMTDATGVATTTVSLGAANGERTIRATAGDVSASVVVTGVCGGLPRTSTAAPAPPAASLGLVALLLASGLLAGRLAHRRPS